jgi:hypothetical protein
MNWFLMMENSFASRSCGDLGLSLEDTLDWTGQAFSSSHCGTPGAKRRNDCVTFSSHYENNLKSCE